MSDQIDLVEQLDLELGNLEKLVDSGDFPQPETLEAFKRRFEEGREGVQSLFAELGHGELAEPTVSEEQTCTTTSSCLTAPRARCSVVRPSRPGMRLCRLGSRLNVI
jgi:hypothetical protein